MPTEETRPVVHVIDGDEQDVRPFCVQGGQSLCVPLAVVAGEFTRLRLPFHFGGIGQQHGLAGSWFSDTVVS